jgi:hypothetical protein
MKNNSKYELELIAALGVLCMSDSTEGLISKSCQFIHLSTKPLHEATTYNCQAILCGMHSGRKKLLTNAIFKLEM